MPVPLRIARFPIWKMQQSAEDLRSALSCRAPRAATTTRSEALARWENAFRPDAFVFSPRVLQPASKHLSPGATPRETRLLSCLFFLLSRSYLSQSCFLTTSVVVE